MIIAVDLGRKATKQTNKQSLGCSIIYFAGSLVRNSKACILVPLTHLSRMGFPTTISRTSPFPVLGVSGGIFHFYSNFNRIFCKQKLETLIRQYFLRRLIWVCTVCPCPTKRTLGLYGLKTVIGVATITHYKHVRSKNNSQGSSTYVFKVIFHTLRNCS